MKINLQQPICDFQGNVLPQTSFGVPSRNPANLGFVLVSALGTSYPDERNLTAEEKMKRYGLAIRLLGVEAGQEVELITEEIVLVKVVVGKFIASSMIFGQIDRILEGKETGIPVNIPKE